MKYIIFNPSEHVGDMYTPIELPNGQCYVRAEDDHYFNDFKVYSESEMTDIISLFHYDEIDGTPPTIPVFQTKENLVEDLNALEIVQRDMSYVTQQVYDDAILYGQPNSFDGLVPEGRISDGQWFDCIITGMGNEIDSRLNLTDDELILLNRASKPVRDSLKNGWWHSAYLDWAVGSPTNGIDPVTTQLDSIISGLSTEFAFVTSTMQSYLNDYY